MRITRRQLLRLIREELEKVEEEEELEEEITPPMGPIPDVGDGTVRRRVDGKISRLDIEAKKQSPAARWD